MIDLGLLVSYFNPRSPCGERRPPARTLTIFPRFQSTLPVWGATLEYEYPPEGLPFQSTLPVWGATYEHSYSQGLPKFQSTLPVWGATPRTQDFCTGVSISIHAPRVGSDAPDCARWFWSLISIHAPRVGSDCSRFLFSFFFFYFNPRSPCGERLALDAPDVPPTEISIHAPRVGSDSETSSKKNGLIYFNPRSPCGERP